MQTGPLRRATIAASAAESGRRGDVRDESRAITREQRHSSRGRSDATPQRHTDRIGQSTTRRIARKAMSVGALVAAAALAVGMTLPAGAFGGGGSATAAQTLGQQIVSADAPQSVVVGAGTGEVVTKDAYDSASPAQLITQARATGDYSYVATTDGDVRWPFTFTSPITDGFGWRVAPCYGCSSQHQGVDFVPGYGTPIQAVTGGLVTEANYSGAWGQHVIVTTEVDGVQVEIVYAHMVSGSSALTVGSMVSPGDPIGQVGSTGASTGAHLHLEVHVAGTPVDPYAWLSARAGAN